MNKSGSQTGNSGYSLIEVLVTIVILAFSTMVIFSAFLRTSDILEHLSYRLQANVILNNLFVSAQEHFQTHGELLNWKSNGQVFVGEESYYFDASTTPIDKEKHLYELRGVVTWKGVKESRLIQSGYLIQ